MVGEILAVGLVELNQNHQQQDCIQKPKNVTLLKSFGKVV